MYKFTSRLCASLCMLMVSAIAANAADNARIATGRTTAQVRMPSMPVSPMNAIGNITADKENTQPTPQPQPEPGPTPECPDGGARDSEYTVANCMNDVLSCVNNGALAGGLNDLFNEDMRNAIMNGMGLCSIQVEKCMVSVRRDCKPVYRSIADVWVDFNSRKIQPEYYNFVLRKTGLTPNQAENTCMLLDKNTYGPSFAAVSNDGATTAEYNNRVGAYNGQMGNVLVKSNPMGVKVNDGNPGVDGARGHYARWDATTATCYLRVGAYNKDQQIKNSWLFGALGNDEMAEVWRAAGDTFSCNKDLFGFSLMNDTKTTAVVGVGGGTLLGAGVGALAGHGKRAFDCSNEKHRTLLMEQIQSDASMRTINQYLTYPISNGAKTVSADTCKEIVALYDKMVMAQDAADACIKTNAFVSDRGYAVSTEGECEGDLEECFKNDKNGKMQACVGKGFKSLGECISFLGDQGMAVAKEALANTTPDKQVIMFDSLLCNNRSFKSLAQSASSDVYCGDNPDGKCVDVIEIRRQLNELNRVFGDPNAQKSGSLAYLIQNGEASNMGKSIGIGAAAGAGAGGVATAITAFVEKNNINCRVGDGLNTVAFGKSHSIDTLKDFYVKWNLRVPDTVSPTSTAVDCKSWKLACAQYTDLEQCKNVALNYKPNVDGTITLVRSACAVSGSVCIENAPVAASYGACVDNAQ